MIFRSVSHYAKPQNHGWTDMQITTVSRVEVLTSVEHISCILYSYAEEEKKL